MLICHNAEELAAQTKNFPQVAFVPTMGSLHEGHLSLIRRAQGYEQDLAQGRSFWQVIPARYGLSLEVRGGSLEDIPPKGPLVLIANHPYGILDGLMMGHILDGLRGDFRILANSVFRKAEELNKVLLPISFDETKEGVKLNLQTRATALDYLDRGITLLESQPNAWAAQQPQCRKGHAEITQ